MSLRMEGATTLSKSSLRALAAIVLVTAAHQAWSAADNTPKPVTLYVAKNGNDQWSGRLPAPNDGTTDGPFATLDRAKAEVRKLKKHNAIPNGATVLVRAGYYCLPKTLSFRPEDAGSENGRIVYRAYDREKVTLSGGRVITNFTPHKGAIVKADVAAAGIKDFDFRTLYFNGKRQHMARYPNHNPDAPICGGWAFVPGEQVRHYGKPIEETAEQRRTLRLRPEDVHDWANPGDGELFVIPNHNWWNHIVGIESVDKAKAVIKLKPDRGFEGRLGDRRFGMKPGCRYYVRGLLEELDAPGEWYLDKKTHILYFWPPADLERGEVVAPAMKSVIHIWKSGFITIQGFTIECCDDSAIDAWQAEGCLFAGNTIRNAVGYSNGHMSAIRITGKNNGAVGNDIHGIGGRGIVMSGGSRDTLEPGGNYADNNYIHHTGLLYKAGVAIRVDGVGNRASHNYIHDTPRGGMSWNGSDHVIEFNHIRHTNTQISDTAGINACNSSWTKRGTVLRYNYIHDTFGFGKNHKGEWVTPHYCWGIYLDNFTTGTTVYGNICARIVLGGPFIHGGRDNLIENNFLIDGNTAQFYYAGAANLQECKDSAKGRVADLMKYGKLPPYQKYPGLAEMFSTDVDEWHTMAGNKFIRNICCYSDGKAALYRPRDVLPDKTQFDYNLVWHHGMPLTVNLPGVEPQKQWDEWKKLGFEQHSLVADPLFVDLKKDDFRLRPDSPAHKLGIKPIPMDKIGCYEHPLRASWPIVEAEGVREHPHRLDLMPKPPKAKPRGPRPTFRVPRRKTAITVDGAVTKVEWNQVNMRRGITLKEDPRGGESKPVSYAYLTFDDTDLYVAFHNKVSDREPLKTAAKWNDNDAVEVALKTPAGKIVALRGYANGQFESSTEAGAPADLAKGLQAATRYGAKVLSKTLWTAEWRISFAALGIDPAKHKEFECNLTVRKTATGQWLMWRGTNGCSWQVSQAGAIALGRGD